MINTPRGSYYGRIGVGEWNGWWGGEHQLLEEKNEGLPSQGHLQNRQEKGRQIRIALCGSTVESVKEKKV